MSRINPGRPTSTRPVGILIVAILRIPFGLVEVGTGFTLNFIGVISTRAASLSTILGVALGGFYFASGQLLLPLPPSFCFAAMWSGGLAWY